MDRNCELQKYVPCRISIGTDVGKYFGVMTIAFRCLSLSSKLACDYSSRNIAKQNNLGKRVVGERAAALNMLTIDSK